MTVIATIHLDGIPPTEVHLRVHDRGPREGQISERHLSALVRGLQVEAGEPYPASAVYTEPYGDDPWAQAIRDARTLASLGILHIAAGAGA